jgi:hypothetical protein
MKVFLFCLQFVENNDTIVHCMIVFLFCSHFAEDNDMIVFMQCILILCSCDTSSVQVPLLLEQQSDVVSSLKFSSSSNSIV